MEKVGMTTRSDLAEKPVDKAATLSVIIASFNTRNLLRDCLKSVDATTLLGDVEVFVVDNDSSDGTPQMVRDEFPGVKVIVNESNLGFATANNRALRLSTGRFVLLLNPDTRVPEAIFSEMCDFMDEHKDVGLAGVRLVRADGSMDMACRRGFPTPARAVFRALMLDRIWPRVFGGYNVLTRDPLGDYEVDAIVGAFMFFRREMVEEVGFLDESFFMFGEDLDWCYRVKRANQKVYYLGSKEVLHVKGASVRQERAKMNYHFHRSMLVFYRKHIDRHYPFFVGWILSAGIGLRWVLKSLLLPFRKSKQ